MYSRPRSIILFKIPISSKEASEWLLVLAVAKVSHLKWECIECDAHSHYYTDSTVLAHIMKTLNDRYDYGLDLYLLSVDEGITGYRDDSLETVKRNQQQYELPLKIVSYHDLYGWSMDDIVREVGRKNNCTYCGVFRRQALDRGAVMLGVNHIVTGHNADDIAETILMNSKYFISVYANV